MIINMKYWQSIVDKSTGEPLGIMCYKCFEPVEKALHEEEANDLERIKENLFMECMCCKRMVNEDYSICGECLEAYPKGYDERVDSSMACTACRYGI